MKCPKCSYLGFETGDRCKNCGYDFSLIESVERAPVEVDLALRLADGDVSERPSWTDEVDRGLGPERRATPYSPEPQPELPGSRAPRYATPPAVPVPRPLIGRPRAAAGAARARATPSLSLFASETDEAGDEPLIKVPAAPRPPLAVRRTPETPKLRSVARSPARVEREPALQCSDEPDTPRPPRESVRQPAAPQHVSGVAARLVAAAIDHCLLLAVDLAVIYFTLRLSALPLSEWQALPPVPLLAFLLLVKVSYFCAFTAVGGQTIGKMAAHIQVVTETGAPVDGARAMRRAIAGVASALTLGVGFVPALVGSERRAIHDRFARTRVIGLRSV